MRRSSWILDTALTEYLRVQSRHILSNDRRFLLPQRSPSSFYNICILYRFDRLKSVESVRSLAEAMQMCMRARRFDMLYATIVRTVELVGDKRMCAIFRQAVDMAGWSDGSAMDTFVRWLRLRVSDSTVLLESLAMSYATTESISWYLHAGPFSTTISDYRQLLISYCMRPKVDLRLVKSLIARTQATVAVDSLDLSNAGLVRLLLSHNLISPSVQKKMVHACLHDGHLQSAKVFHELGSVSVSQWNAGNLRAAAASPRNAVDMIQFLVSDEWTGSLRNLDELNDALFSAVIAGNYDAIVLLLELGADAQSSDGDLVEFAWASPKRNRDIIKVLIDNGATYHPPSSLALRMHAQAGSPESLQNLDLNNLRDWRDFLLGAAVDVEHPSDDMILFLLELSANETPSSFVLRKVMDRSSHTVIEWIFTHYSSELESNASFYIKATAHSRHHFETLIKWGAYAELVPVHMAVRDIHVLNKVLASSTSWKQLWQALHKRPDLKCSQAILSRMIHLDEINRAETLAKAFDIFQQPCRHQRICDCHDTRRFLIDSLAST